jgi:hypothetical protein
MHGEWISLEREEVAPTKNTVLDALRGVARQGDWPDVIHSVDRLKRNAKTVMR